MDRSKKTLVEQPAGPTTEQIAQRAHELWISEGRPPGRARHSWLLAEAILQAEHSEAQTRAKSRSRTKSKQTQI